MSISHLILRQKHGKPCEVVFYDSNKETSEVKFSGGRWAARRYLRDLMNDPAWENVPARNEKAGRNGYGRIVDMVRGEL